MENEPFTSKAEKPLDNPDSLREQVGALRRVMIVTLLILVGASFPLNIYLMSQVRHVTRDLERLRPQQPRLQEMMAQYKNNFEPNVKKLVADLQGYAERRPKISPILKKYKILPARGATNQLEGPVGTNAPALAPSETPAN